MKEADQVPTLTQIAAESNNPESPLLENHPDALYLARRGYYDAGKFVPMRPGRAAERLWLIIFMIFVLFIILGLGAFWLYVMFA